MNRRKKIKQIIKSRSEKANAKKAAVNKPKYISKAERAKLAVETDQNSAADANDSSS